MLKPQQLSDEARAFPGLNLESIEGTVLATIVNAKVPDVLKMDISALPKRSEPFRSLKKALTEGKGRTFILECKKSSPTLGDFCKDFNLDRLLSCYESRASAISVLCEEHFFKGSLDYLRYVRERTSLPVICKDFIIDEKQLLKAASAGADAVLLMLSMLTRQRFLELYAKAVSLGLEVLCEVDSRDDALFAAEHKFPVVGINNRDLRILKIDLNNAKKLAPLLKDIAVVSESGISSHQDLIALKPIRSFLIGSSLSGSDDLFFSANTMLYGTNKVCGITTEDALKAAIEGHAAIAGLIFCKKSPRYVSLELARKLGELAQNRIKIAAVFVDAPLDEMIDAVKICKASYVQLHGHESTSIIKKLRDALPGINIIKALCVRQDEDFKAYETYAPLCDLMILDSGNPGSGTSFNWSAIPDFIKRDHTLLSGGIGCNNLNEALSQGFLGVDMNSALESQKGIKDPKLVKQALQIIHDFI